MRFLTQGNFYKKGYRQTACQNLDEDFLQLDLQQILPLKKSLVKSIAKQAARVDRALNDGRLFSSVEVAAEIEE